MAGSTTKTRRSGLGRPPAFVAPALATLVDSPPDGDAWLHETKYDGYRCLLALGGGDVVCYTRSGQDWTERFQSLVAPACRLPAGSALIDGEVAVLDAAGRSGFSLLQQALHEGKPLVYYAFDLLALDGADLRRLPLVERKKRLARLIGRRQGPIRFSDHVLGHGAEILKKLCAAGYEGIVSKRAEAPYRSGRGHDWLKIKCGKRQEFVIGGWSPSTRRTGFRSLLLGYYVRGRLVYAGRVGTGFDADTLADVGARLRKIEIGEAPFETVPRSVARTAHWVKPVLVAEIAFTEFTSDGIVRHGAFLGLRGDKPATSITIELPHKALTR